ncbi:MAG TPA: hypothetical protein EYH47_21980 [Pseudomonas oleovorans]|nr:hypothetical protein [Pseudomonas oleovorans]
MAESSEDKTIRKYLHTLTTNAWSYQHCVFYQEPSESILLLDDMVSFKQTLRRKCPDQPFLIRIQLLNREKRFQAYLMILTTQRVMGIQELADKVFSAPTNTIGRICTPERISSMATKIRSQKPHDLQWLFKKPQVRRWTTLNKEKLPPPQT